MREIVRTNDDVLVTVIESLLGGAKIPHIVLDRTWDTDLVACQL